MHQNSKRWAFRLIALLITTVLCGIILELGSYHYLRATRGYDGVHLMNYQFDPYKIIQLTPDYVDERGIVHNAEGFRRQTDTPAAKPPDTLRVFLMGASTAYGLQSLSRFGSEKYPFIRNDETIDHYLELALADAIPDKRVEVINAAITSFYSHHHLIYLNQTVLKYAPDVVIFLDGFNDYYHDEPGYDQFRDFAYSERVSVFMGEPTFGAWARYTGWWLFRKSHFFNAAGRALRNLQLMQSGDGRNRQIVDVEPALARMAENADRNWVEMVERNGLILGHEGVEAIFALQPEIAFDPSKKLSPLEEKIFDEIANLWPENYVEFKRRARPIVMEKLTRASASVGSGSIDLTDIYADESGDVYTDYCHLTPRGNEVLALALKPAVLAALERRVHPPNPSGTE